MCGCCVWFVVLGCLCVLFDVYGLVFLLLYVALRYLCVVCCGSLIVGVVCCFRVACGLLSIIGCCVLYVVCWLFFGVC